MVSDRPGRLSGFARYMLSFPAHVKASGPGAGRAQLCPPSPSGPLRRAHCCPPHTATWTESVICSCITARETGKGSLACVSEEEDTAGKQQASLCQSQGHREQGTFQQEKRTPQRTMVLAEASRTFCVSHEGDFMNDRRQSMLPSPPTHLRNRCKNLLHLFLHQHLWSTQTSCQSPCSMLRL